MTRHCARQMPRNDQPALLVMRIFRPLPRASTPKGGGGDLMVRVPNPTRGRVTGAPFWWRGQRRRTPQFVDLQRHSRRRVGELRRSSAARRLTDRAAVADHAVTLAYVRFNQRCQKTKLGLRRSTPPPRCEEIRMALFHSRASLRSSPGPTRLVRRLPLAPHDGLTTEKIANLVFLISCSCLRGR